MNDRRLIEDFLPIREISAEATREKSVRQGHISTLHLWWARRPLVACRAAVYGALVPAPENPKSRGPKGKFVAALCTYPKESDKQAQAQLQQRLEKARYEILEAHAERLTAELVGENANHPDVRPAWAAELNFTGDQVTIEDIEAGRAPRPRVLDMFAGGGAIPLEALRLGCEAYALDLNPVAHLIELCTLVYPQKYGKQLAKDVEYWGKWVLERVKEEIGDLYPGIDAGVNGCRGEGGQQVLFDGAEPVRVNPSAQRLTPAAYLWTRTVRCKRSDCGATVPLARQTWLCKKKGRYVALRPTLPNTHTPAHPHADDAKRVCYTVVSSSNAALPDDFDPKVEWGFDPSSGAHGGNVACPFCGTVADNDYIKAEGKAGRIGRQPMAVVFTHAPQTENGKTKKEQGKVYLSADDLSPSLLPDDEAIQRRLEKLCKETGLTVPEERIEANPRSFDTQHFGFERWCDLFTPRQLLALMTFCKYVRAVPQEMQKRRTDEERDKAVATFLGLLLSKIADLNNSLCHYEPVAQCPRQMFCRQAVPMVWDFGESVSISDSTGSWVEHLKRVVNCVNITHNTGIPAEAVRGSATRLPFPQGYLDAVITDPPYYDNVTYSNLADFFYVWLKRSVGHLYPEHFTGELTPKRNEAIVATYRHDGNRERAKQFYEDLMAEALDQTRHALKPSAPMVMVYAHKTMAGWSTLVDALRRAGFVITEAWPIDTENTGRTIAADTAALASSIFLVARRRESEEMGSYEDEVRPELEEIVRERVESLWKEGISGADLVIAAVGAGLRAYTRFARVEYANGDEAPADAFLHEVEGVVLETLLEKIFGIPRSGIAAVDAPTRFYVLWRYTYRQAELDAGEAIVFAYPQGVELDGARGLSAGAKALIEKKKGKYRLLAFDERGNQESLGQPAEDATPAPIIDVLHRSLYLMEHSPPKLGEFLNLALLGRAEQMRLIAHALAGPSLHGGESTFASTPEISALRTLTANWRSLVEENLFR